MGPAGLGPTPLRPPGTQACAKGRGGRRSRGRTRAGPEPPMCPHEHVRMDMLALNDPTPTRTCPHEHVRTNMSAWTCPHGHARKDMSSRTCHPGHVSRAPESVARASSPAQHMPARPVSAPRVGGVRLSAPPTARSFSASLGAGGPKGGWTESGGTGEVGRDTVRPPCLRAEPPSDTRLRPVARAPKPVSYTHLTLPTSDLV